MKYVICSIYDTAVDAYMRPFVAQSPGEAVRMFVDETNREGTPLNAHPEDYALFQIGEFYDHNAEITTDKTVECLARAHEVINKEEE